MQCGLSEIIKILIQGVSFKIFVFQTAVAHNWRGSDPKLVKPKCV